MKWSPYFGLVLILNGLFPVLLSAQVDTELLAPEAPLDCLDCHTDTDVTMMNDWGEEVTIAVDPEIIKDSVHKENTCFSCHRDITDEHPDDEVAAEPVDCARCHEKQSASYGASVHGVALAKGDDAAASCADCHGSHAMKPIHAPESPLAWANQAETCGECHFGVAYDFEESIHGQALAMNIREAPSCTDCHFEHRIQELKSASPLKIAVEVCSRCHSSERMNSKFEIPPNRVDTFFESYHGLAAEYGSVTAANCASCHGYHLVLPSSDPRSSIHPDHLVETCGQCHPGVSQRFVESKVHISATRAEDFGSMVNVWVRRIYLLLIVVTIGGMVLHNFLAWRRKVLTSFYAKGRKWVRMDGNQRWQHLLLMISFAVLAFSGFALEYPNSILAWMLGSDETIRRMTHRIAAVILLGLGVYHLIYVSVTYSGRRLLGDLLPRAKDFRIFMGNLRYFFDRRISKPRTGRFGYAEKVEYWAVFWGTTIMGVTGFMLWFAVSVTEWLPRWSIDVAKTIHYYEAILALLAILVWHLYHVILDPDVYPMNWAWWDGRVHEEWYKEEHADDPRLAEKFEVTSNGPEVASEPVPAGGQSSAGSSGGSLTKKS